MTAEKLNVLFVCGKNQWRSPTAEKLYWRHPRLNTRSRGVQRQAVKRATTNDIEWADLIFVMEEKHKDRLLAKCHDRTARADVHILEIPDDYRYMDPELIALLEEAIDPVIDACLKDLGD